MTLVASILAPALTGIALQLEPPQAHWPSAPVGLEGPPAPVATLESFSAAARGGDGSPPATAGDSPSGGTESSGAPHEAPRWDEASPSDALRWLLAFAGLAAIGAVRNLPRRC